MFIESGTEKIRKIIDMALSSLTKIECNMRLCWECTGLQEISFCLFAKREASHTGIVIKILELHGNICKIRFIQAEII